MKKFTLLAFFPLLLLLFWGNMEVQAQNLDTLDVPVDPTSQQNFTLQETITSDNFSHVYRLERGGIYWMDAFIENTKPLVIVGQDDPTGKTRPPLLMYATGTTGQAPDYMILAHSSVYLKNLYVAAIDDQGNLHGFYRTVDDSMRVEVYNCIFDYSTSWHGHFDFESHQGTAIFKDNTIMNMIDFTGYTWTTFFHTQGVPIDTLIMQNNTFINNANDVFSINNGNTNSPHYVKIDHNTVYGTGKELYHYAEWLQLYSTNNLFYDPEIMGDAIQCNAGYATRIQDPDGLPYAMFMVDTISVDQSIKDSLLQAVGIPHRIVQINHNDYYQSPTIVNFLKSLPPDTGLVPQLLNSRSAGMFANKTMWPGLEWDSTTNIQEDPGFVKTPDNEKQMVAWANYEYRGGDAKTFIWIPTGDSLIVPWPIPVDFSYTNQKLLTGGVGGYPLGDLNWFPDKKKQWEGNPTAVKKHSNETPNSFSLMQNYPNPFNPSTRVDYSINKSGEVSLIIYNMLGQKIRTLVSANQAAGHYNVSWNGTDSHGNVVANGIYFYRLILNNQQSLIRKMVLLK